MKCSIVIPTYNEDLNIYNLVGEILKEYKVKVIIVDDGSRTPVVINNKDVEVLRNKSNKGKGEAIVRGIKYSSESGFDYSIVLDGDLQHHPKHIQAFLDEPDCDIVLGYRDISNPMPFQRILSNKITSLIISTVIGKKIIDSQNGYRRYKNSIVNVNHFSEKGFHFESEILIKLGRKISIRQIPIDTIYNKSKSHIKPFHDTISFIKLIFKHILYGTK